MLSEERVDYIDGPTGQPRQLVTVTQSVEQGADLAEETYRLALESIDRWGRRYRVSPAMRLRAIRAVVTSALQSDGA